MVEVTRRVGKWPTRLYGPLAYKVRYIGLDSILSKLLEGCLANTRNSA